MAIGLCRHVIELLLLFGEGEEEVHRRGDTSGFIIIEGLTSNLRRSSWVAPGMIIRGNNVGWGQGPQLLWVNIWVETKRRVPITKEHKIKSFSGSFAFKCTQQIISTSTLHTNGDLTLLRLVSEASLTATSKLLTAVQWQQSPFYPPLTCWLMVSTKEWVSSNL